MFAICGRELHSPFDKRLIVQYNLYERNGIMEITLAIIISIVSTVISVTNFALGRKDKSNKDIKEEQKQFDNSCDVLMGMKKEIDNIIG